MMVAALRRPASLARRLAGDRSGLALLEFALTLPLVVAVGGYGSELSYLALTNLKVSQFALNLADHASRVGLLADNGVTQLREADINDILSGVQLQGKAMGLTTYGRVTLSSLENIKQSYDTTQVQRIHWQRCIGAANGTDAASGRKFDSNYGAAAISAGSDGTQANAGVAAPNGMGDTDSQVVAPADNGVMFVEVNYRYQPLFGTLFVTPPMIHYVASFIVRDNRDYTRLWNFTPAATKSTCDLHNANAPDPPR